MPTSKKIVIVIVGIIILLLVSIFVRNILTPNEVITNDAPQDSNLAVKKITVQEKYNDGEFTLYGAIVTERPCEDITITDNSLSSEEGVVVLTVNTGSPVKNCDAIITDQIFEYSFEASENVQLKGLLNGNPVEFNRIKIPSDEAFVNPIGYTKG